MEIKLISHGLCRIMATTASDLEPIRNYFKTANPSKFFVQHHSPQASVPDFIYGISTMGVFKLGLLPAVLKVMNTCGISYEVDPDIIRSFYPLRTLGIEPVIHELPCESHDDFEYRPYQHEAVEIYLKHGRGTIVMATASGKSFVIAKTMYSLLKSAPEIIKHCLILVPSASLVIQFYNDLLDYGLTEDEVSMFSSKSKKCKDTSIIISNSQWLNNHFDELPYIDVVQVDEAHRFSTPGSKAAQMVSEFETDIRFACTATMPNTIEKKWELIGIVGPVLFKRSAKEMIEAGYISNLHITSIHVHDKDIEKDTQCLFSKKRKVTSEILSEPYELERNYVVDNMEKLYTLPVDHILSISENTNTLFLFDFIDFGESFFEFVKKRVDDPSKVFYIDGRIDVIERERIRKLIEGAENAIIIAQSVCFNTGINIKKLHNIGFVFNSKSGSKIIQSVGRVLRKHESKEYATLFDINFNFKYSTRHHAQRRTAYRGEYDIDVSEVVTFKV